jgi:Nitric oxide synthase, oxygenase domain
MQPVHHPARARVQGCKELLERAAQHRGSVPYLAAFRPRAPAARDGPRVWNSQLVRFACYERNDETLLGDPANKAFTDFCIRSLGWKPPPRRTAFDVLPLVLQARHCTALLASLAISWREHLSPSAFCWRCRAALPLCFAVMRSVQPCTSASGERERARSSSTLCAGEPRRGPADV